MTTQIEVGRVGRAHGLDGSFYVTRAQPRLLVLGASVAVGGRDTTIVRRAGTDQRPIVRMDGVESREGADELRGQTLLVAQAAAPVLEPGEFWAHELVGCRVLADQQPVGVVMRMVELPSCEALEVHLDAGGEMLVPMVSDAIGNVDPGARRITVDPHFLGLERTPR